VFQHLIDFGDFSEQAIHPFSDYHSFGYLYHTKEAQSTESTPQMNTGEEKKVNPKNAAVIDTRAA